MPIKGEYTWTEKSDCLVVRVPLKGVSPKKVDIFCTENILKVNFVPYLVDILLHASVDSLKHKAIVKEGYLEIKLLKKVPGLWGVLECQVDAKDELVEKRTGARH